MVIIGYIIHATISTSDIASFYTLGNCQQGTHQPSGSSWYYPLCNSYTGWTIAWQSGSGFNTEIPVSGRGRNFKIIVFSPPGNGLTYTFTLTKNGAPIPGAQITISGVSQTTGSVAGPFAMPAMTGTTNNEYNIQVTSTAVSAALEWNGCLEVTVP